MKLTDVRRAALMEVRAGQVRWGERCGWQAPEHRRQPALDWLDAEGLIAIHYGAPKLGKVTQTVPVSITLRGSLALRED